MVWIQNVEAFFPCVAVQSEADRETRGWDRLTLTAQFIIPAASTTNGLTIMSSLPLSIHRFLNARNVTALQADYKITYMGHNIYLPSVEEVKVPTLTGGQSIITDKEETATSMVGSGVTVESMVSGPTSRMDIIVVTGVHVGYKGIHLTLPTPRMERDISVVRIPIETEVGQDK